jgi:chemotaxis protein methyltransferase WspC
VKELAAIAALLRQRVGFDANIIGDRKIIKAVQARQTICNLPDAEAYLKTVQHSAQEFAQLVEQLVVPETWFFRDRKPFDFLVRAVRSGEMPQLGVRKLRVLSAPCSTGEEPYSLAIALLEAGLTVSQFTIDAVDISQQALEKAQQATYGKNSFRSEDWVERSRYFQLDKDKYRVCPTIRNVVNFRQENILTGLSSISLKHDVIFCRNLLIYLDESACRQILNQLHSLLVPQGLLFVGAAETSKVPSDRFLYLRQPLTFAYRKVETSAKVTASRPEAPKRTTLENHSIRSSTPAMPLPYAQIQPSQDLGSSPEPLSNLDLQQAKQLADAGDLLSAIDCCKTYLESHLTDVEAYALLGTLYQATAHPEQSERYLQKALYLQPNHYEALMQLALLKESQGDTTSAKLLQQRIQKLQHSNTTADSAH